MAHRSERISPLSRHAATTSLHRIHPREEATKTEGSEWRRSHKLVVRNSCRLRLCERDRSLLRCFATGGELYHTDRFGGPAFRAILGAVPSEDVLETTQQLAPNLLGAVLRPGRTPTDIADIIRRQTSSGLQGSILSSLDAYSGFGEAAGWGKALAADLADYAADRLPCN